MIVAAAALQASAVPQPGSIVPIPAVRRPHHPYPPGLPPDMAFLERLEQRTQDRKARWDLLQGKYADQKARRQVSL